MIKLLSVAALGIAVSLVSVAGANEQAEEKEGAEATSQATQADEPVRSGKQVYESLCMACHSIEGPATVAPPIFAVKNHVVQVYPERDDFIKRVVEWVKAPDVDDPLMPGAVRKFGLMPAMPLADAELTAVAEFLYDSDMVLPDWYKQHYKEEHGEEPSEPEQKEAEKSE